MYIIACRISGPADSLYNLLYRWCVRWNNSLHVALQLNWILVAALEDYHAELPDGSRNKKANTVYFNRCAKLLQVKIPWRSKLEGMF